MTDNQTRSLLKDSAIRLFARRGLDGVSVRDIVLEAGQKNSGSLHYYFGSKEELARELVADGAKLIDERRNAKLRVLEEAGRPIKLREIIEILVWPSTQLTDTGEGNYIRFITLLQMSHRQFFFSSLEGKWASGYERCLNHIRKILSGVDPEIVDQRLFFMSLLLRSALSSREAALETGVSHRFWTPAFTMENLMDSVESILKSKPSRATEAALQSHRNFQKDDEEADQASSSRRGKGRKGRNQKSPEVVY